MKRDSDWWLSGLFCVVLAGCGEPVAPEPGGITVRGAVVDEYLNPQPGAGVMIGGHPVTTTDGEGKFSVTGVNAPYDLSTALLAERGALIYQGLTREDPLIVVPAGQFSERHRASTGGYVDGGTGLPEPADHRTRVWFESPQMGLTASLNGSWFYYVSAEWTGPATTTGTVHALQWQVESGSGLPVTYSGYGSGTGVELQAWASVTGPDVLMSALTTASISGSVAVPSGYTLSSKAFGMSFGVSTFPRVGLEIALENGSSKTFDYITPDVPGATFAVSARAQAGTAWSLAVRTGLGATASGVEIIIPTPPEPVAPAEGVTGPDTFTWTPMSRAVYLLSIRYAGSQLIIPQPPSFYVLTTKTTATVPNLNALGIAPPAAAEYVWQVFAWAPFRNVDEVAVETWFAPQGDASSAASVSRGFRNPR